MADTTISQLQSISALSATNYAVVSNGTVTSKIDIFSLRGGYKNKITNGDMRVDQYYNGGVITANAGTVPLPSIDRWQLNNSGSTANLTWQRVDDAPPGFRYSLKTSVISPQTGIVTAATWATIRQWHNGSIFNDLAYGTNSAKPVTLSFWVKSSILGNFPVNLYCFGYNYCSLYSINAVNTWEYKVITIPGITTAVTNNNVEVEVGLRFPLMVGTDNITSSLNTWNAGGGAVHSSATLLNTYAGATLHMTGIQLETGSVATPFEMRPYGVELLECQRYQLILGNNNNGYAPIASGYIRNATQAFYMRNMSPFFAQAPALSANPGAFIIDDGNIQIPTSITLDRYCDGTIMFYASVTNNSLTTGRGSILYSNPSGTGRLLFYTGH